jgi:uncharacterized protein DUF349
VPIPIPKPGPPRPAGVRPAPPAARPAPAAVREDGRNLDWGRVDETGAVFVRTKDGERQVGQWPEGDPKAALAFYAKRYEGLAVEVDLLSRRVQAGSLSPDEARSTVAKVRETVVEAQAVGDLDALVQRLDALTAVIDERRAERKADRAAKVEEAKHEKEKIAVDAERLAESDDWRNGATRLRDLLEAWKALPRIDKASDDELWHRFSSARTTYTRRRKQHFADLNSKRDEARAAKEKLITEAEALSASTEWGATAAAYRDLMTRWKAVGPANKDVDDALWWRFRSAQDTFFEARDAQSSKAESEFQANAQVKRGLLAEAEKLLPVTNPSAARATFRELAERWDRAGKVPRGDVRTLEDRFKAIEETIRSAEDERWRRSSPEAQARASETVRKLEATLEALRSDLAKASAAGNTKKVAEAQAAIEARESWLEQARKSQSEFGA